MKTQNRNVIFSILVSLSVTLIACTPHHGDTTIAGVSPALQPGLRIGAASYDGPSSDVQFANRECTHGNNSLARVAGNHPNYFNQLSAGDKEKCVRIISELCAQFDYRSNTVENIPAWRPEGVPAGYLLYIRRERGDGVLKNHFACAMYSTMIESLTQVQQQRAALGQIFQSRRGGGAGGAQAFNQDRDLARSIQFVRDLSEQYDAEGRGVSFDVPWHDSTQKMRWGELFAKVDMLPVPLFLGIAANESIYATSGWTIRAWNMWGRHAADGAGRALSCYRAGTCTVSENVSPASATVGMVKYYSLEQTLDDQVRYLNRHWSRYNLQRVRFNERAAGRRLTTDAVAEGMNGYAQGSHALNYAAIIHGFVGGAGASRPQTNWIKYDNMFAEDVVPAEVLAGLEMPPRR